MRFIRALLLFCAVLGVFAVECRRVKRQNRKFAQLKCRSYPKEESDPSAAECNNLSSGPITQTTYIHARVFFSGDQIKSPKNLKKVSFDFHPLNKIFLGIGDVFPNLEVLEVRSTETPVEYIKRLDFKNLNNLTTLDLSQNDLTFVSEDCFWDVKELRSLDLSLNKLQSLPQYLLIHTQKLEKFFAAGNSIEKIPPALFNRVPNLKMLVLSGNSRLNLGETLTLPLQELKILDLSSTGLTKVPGTLLSNSSSLSGLFLGGNRLELTEDSFSNFKGIKRLEINSCHLTEIPENIFSPLNELRILNLEANKLEALGKNIFTANLKLEIVRLDENKIRKIGVDFTLLININTISLKKNDCIDEVFSSSEQHSLITGFQNSITTLCS